MIWLGPNPYFGILWERKENACKFQKRVTLRVIGHCGCKINESTSPIFLISFSFSMLSDANLSTFNNIQMVTILYCVKVGCWDRILYQMTDVKDKSPLLVVFTHGYLRILFSIKVNYLYNNRINLITSVLFCD